MIISVDHSGLEWVTAVYLSQDPVGMQEIRDGVNLHTENQKRFNLPERVIAKRFLFRLIFCKEDTAAWSFANDIDFNHVSTKVDYWQEVIDGFYSKYERLFIGWHGELMDQVAKTGKYEAIDGRVYNFKPYEKKGIWQLPKTLIYNYPVQGLGASIVMLSRISLWNRLTHSDLAFKFVNTVHDDIWLDVLPQDLDALKVIIKGVFDDLPKNFERAFKVPFNLPTRFEIKTLTGEPV